MLLASVAVVTGCANTLDVPFVGEDGEETAILMKGGEEVAAESAGAGGTILHYELRRPVAASAGSNFALRVDPDAGVERITLFDGEGGTIGDRVVGGVTDTGGPREYRVAIPEDATPAGFSIHTSHTDSPASEASAPESEGAVFTFAGLRSGESGFVLENGHAVIGTALRRLEGASPGGTPRDVLVGLDLSEASIVELTYAFGPTTPADGPGPDETAAPGTSDRDGPGATDEAGQAMLVRVPLQVACAGPGAAGASGGSTDATASDATTGSAGDATPEDPAGELTLTLRPGGRSVYLHRASFGCAPATLRLGELPAEFRLVSVKPIDLGEGAYAPVPADLGVILEHYPQTSWRRSDFELFSWSLYPEILIFDMRSYATQSRFFKRLAFFAEKRDYRGELLTNRELTGLHGWNAHNYRPEGLADFFNLADAEGFELNAEELLLKEVLLANGVLRPAGGDDDGTVRPGDGGILSISRESYPVLRQLLLTHEAFHGVFYADQDFRRGVFAQWDALSSAEREYWRELLSFLTYDPSDRYLMVNEFQGYLLQQPEERVRGYFRGTLAGRLARRRGSAFVNEFLEAHPDTFEAAARRVNRLAFETSGVIGGDVYCLR